jgi:hypothetical protein
MLLEERHAPSSHEGDEKPLIVEPRVPKFSCSLDARGREGSKNVTFLKSHVR